MGKQTIPHEKLQGCKVARARVERVERAARGTRPTGREDNFHADGRAPRDPARKRRPRWAFRGADAVRPFARARVRSRSPRGEVQFGTRFRSTSNIP
jgi:hypothetical protein